jgi:transposase-like protein
LQGEELQVGMKKRVARWLEEFRRMAVERMKTCDNVAALAKELGVYRCLLYEWRDHFGSCDEVYQLKQVLADKTLELDFFKGALQKVEARRRQSGGSGAQGSTTKSKK